MRFYIPKISHTHTHTPTDSATSGDQILKHMSWWEIFYIQTIANEARILIIITVDPGNTSHKILCVFGIKSFNNLVIGGISHDSKPIYNKTQMT